MLFSAMIAAAFLLADTSPAAAAAAATPPAPAAAASPAEPAKTEKPKLVCRSEPVLGSLMTKKTCYNPDQAKERQQAERQNLEAIQNKH